MDEIRKMDWIPRTLRQKQKKMDAAAAKIEAERGRTAKGDEIANELGISVEEYENWKAEAEFTNLISLDDYLEQGNDGSKISAARSCDPKAGIEGNASGSPPKTDRKRAECHHIILLRRIDIKRD